MGVEKYLSDTKNICTRVMFRNQPITTTVLSTRVAPTVVTEYVTITRRLPPHLG